MTEVLVLHHALGRTAGVHRLPEVELITCPGSQHLFADDSTPAHDASAARDLEDRVLAFLASLG